MRKSLLAGALTLALGSTLLVPAAEARDGDRRHRGHGYGYGHSHRPYKPYYKPYRGSRYRPYFKPYREYHRYRPYGYYDYRPYRYHDHRPYGYYDGYYPYPPKGYFHHHRGVRCSRPHVEFYFEY